MVSVVRMTSVEFARSYALRAPAYAWLVGAGASAAGGVPTGRDMILDFKSRLFCSETGLPRHLVDPSDPIWNERITAHFDNSLGLPPEGDPEEYAAAFEAVFPDVDDRRAYIAECVLRGKPTFGHRVLAGMVASGKLPCVFTTNFDQLIERAVSVAAECLPVGECSDLAVATLDSAGIARRCLRDSNWPLLVKLHGDYQSTRLKNTKEELQGQDRQLRRVLTQVVNRFGLVVVGYSGRDDSVMSAVTDALEGQSPFPTGVRWVVRSGRDPLDSVREFLDGARRKGVDARLVEAETFDELAADICDQISLPPRLATHVLRARPEPVLQPVDLSQRVAAATFPVLRCSALPVLQLPQAARRLVVRRPVTSGEARKALKAGGFRGIVAARGQEIAAFGADEDLLEALKQWGAELGGEQTLDPRTDSWALGLIYDALVRALTRGRPLRPRLRRLGHVVTVARTSPRLGTATHEADLQLLQPLREAYGHALLGKVPQLGFPFAEAVRIRIEMHNGQWWCVFDPVTWVELPNRSSTTGRHAPAPAARGGDLTGGWRKERWARKYNTKWSKIIDAWARLLVPEPESTMVAVELSGRAGVNASFKLAATTAWASPARSNIKQR